MCCTEEKEKIEEQVNLLYLTVHTANFNTSVQTLMLLYQVMHAGYASTRTELARLKYTVNKFLPIIVSCSIVEFTREVETLHPLQSVLRAYTPLYSM